ncbi:MAG: superoxide dismutase [Bryobacteraceae bacterium]|nr:superoxide dismutase [Bryobacteraceae bacterium]MDW8377765.1 superoxide dismutase [Bryobacterales bacterium]
MLHLSRRQAVPLLLGLTSGVRPALAAPYTLPKLPYAVDALEPYIDARTMEIHHGRHHQAYVDNLNKALAGEPALADKPLEQLLASLDSVPASIRTMVRNHGGGHANHSLFWQSLGPAKGTAPKGALAKAIQSSFSSQSAFEAKVTAAAMGVFGSGWAWVVVDGKQLTVETTPNQDTPLMRAKKPLFGIDVWEHAYYLKYQNRRADYLAAIWKVVNWDFLNTRYEELTR